MKNRFYTYIYLDPRKRSCYCYKDMCFLYEPVYVGKGQGKRCLEHLKYLDRYIKGQNNHFKRKLLKIVKNEFVGFDVEKYVLVVRDGLVEREAFELEKRLIQEIGRIDLKTGPLTNLSDGGQGGGARSKEVREKISKTLKGRVALNKGCKLSEAAKERISKGMKEFRAKQRSLNKVQRNPNARLTEKQVHQIHMLLRLGFKTKHVSEVYGVDFTTAHSIKIGRSWHHIYTVFNRQEDMA